MAAHSEPYSRGDNRDGETFLSNEGGALRLSCALLALGVGLVYWGLVDPSSANDSFSALT